MKPIKMVGISIIAFLFIFGSLFTWQVWAQDDTNSEGRTSVYLPLILGDQIQIQAADASTDNVEMDNINNDDSTFLPAAEFYAEKYKVSLEEALYRIKLQPSIGDLNANLETAEAESFAGLWIEHEPSYKVVIQFTHDAERTLEPYLPGISFAHLIEARTAKISVQELQKIHDRMVEKINVLEMAADSTVQADSAINIIQNRIDIFVTDPEAVDWPAVLGDDNKYAAVVKIDALPVPAADIQ